MSGRTGLGEAFRRRLVHAPWASLLVGGITLAVAANGAAVEERPTLDHRATVIVDSPLPFGLTSSRLDAAFEDVRTQRELTVRVYAASIPQQDRTAYPDDLLIGLEQPWTDSSAYSPVSVVAPQEQDATARATLAERTRSALGRNLQLGNTSTAIAGAVQTWQDVRATPSDSTARTIGVALGSTAAVGLLVWYLLRMREWRRRRAGITRDRRRVASVVVDLDALAAGALTVPGEASTQQRHEWTRLSDRAVQMLEWEDSLAELHRSPSSAASEAARCAREIFHANAAELQQDAQRLNLSSSYLAERTGAISAWDRAIEPSVLESQALSRELDAAPPIVRLHPAVRTVSELRDAMLALGDDVEHGRLTGHRVVQRLGELEQRSRAAALELVEAFGARATAGTGRAAVREYVTAGGVVELRADLGLPDEGAAAELFAARGALAGYLAGTGAVIAPVPASGEGTNAPVGDPVRFWERPQWVVGGVAIGAVIIAAGSWAISGIMVPEFGGLAQGAGTGRVERLSIGAKDHGVDEAAVRSATSIMKAPLPMTVTIEGLSTALMDPKTLRGGEREYEAQQGTAPFPSRLTALRAAIEKNPTLQDPATGDLLPGSVLILVDGPPVGTPANSSYPSREWGEGTGGDVLAVGLGAVQRTGLDTDITFNNEYRNRAHSLNRRPPEQLTSDVERVLSGAATDLSTLVSGDGPHVGAYGMNRAMERAPVAALIMSGAALATTALVGLIALGRGIAASFTPTGALFARIRRRLASLSLREDETTLEAVAVLGERRASAAEQEHRLYVSRLSEARRRWDELDSLGMRARRSPETLHRLEALDALTAALETQDEAVAAQAATALRSSDPGRGRS